MDSIRNSTNSNDSQKEGNHDGAGNALLHLRDALTSASASLDNGWIDDTGLHVWRNEDGTTPGASLTHDGKQVLVDLDALDSSGRPFRLQDVLPDTAVHIHACEAAFARSLLVPKAHRARSTADSEAWGPWPLTWLGWQWMQRAGLNPASAMHLTRAGDLRTSHWHWTFAQNPKTPLWSRSYAGESLLERDFTGVPARPASDLAARVLLAAASDVRLRQVDHLAATATAGVTVARSNGTFVHIRADPVDERPAECCACLQFGDAPILPARQPASRHGVIIIDLDAIACRSQVSFALGQSNHGAAQLAPQASIAQIRSTPVGRLSPWGLLSGDESLANLHEKQRKQPNFHRTRSAEALAALAPSLAMVTHDGEASYHLDAEPLWLVQAPAPHHVPIPPGVGLTWARHGHDILDPRCDETANAIAATALLATVATGTPMSMAILADLRGFELRLSAVATRNDSLTRPVLVAQDILPLGVADFGLLALGKLATCDDLANLLAGIHEGSEATKRFRPAGRLFYEVICTLAAEFCAALLSDEEWFRDVWHFTGDSREFPTGITADELRSELSVSIGFSGWGFAPLWRQGRLATLRELETLRLHLECIANCGAGAAGPVTVRLPAPELVRLATCRLAPHTCEAPGASFGAWGAGHSGDMSRPAWHLPSSLKVLGFVQENLAPMDCNARALLPEIVNQAHKLLARALRLPHADWATLIRDWRELATERLGSTSTAWSLPALSGLGVSSFADFRHVLPDNLNPLLAKSSSSIRPESPPRATPQAVPQPPRALPKDGHGPRALRVGDRQSLTSLKMPLQFIARLECTAVPDDFDVELAALLLGSSGRMTSETDAVFFNNEQHVSGAVSLMPGKSLYVTDGAQRVRSLRFDLASVPRSVERIAVLAFLYDGPAKSQTFARTGGLSFALRIGEQPDATAASLAKDCVLAPRSDGIRVFDFVRDRQEANWSIEVCAVAINGGLSTAYDLFGV
jgi:stress response protein SCP2